MSDSVALALIIAGSWPGLFIFYYLSNMAAHAGEVIATGQLQGVPISVEHRWILLVNTWVSRGIGAFISGIFVAAVNWRIGAVAIDADIKLVAFLAAFMGALGSVSWLLFGPVEFLFTRGLQLHARVLEVGQGELRERVEHGCSCGLRGTQLLGTGVLDIGTGLRVAS